MGRALRLNLGIVASLAVVLLAGCFPGGTSGIPAPCKEGVPPLESRPQGLEAMSPTTGPTGIHPPAGPYRIAFSTEMFGRNPDIATVNPDGSDVVRITADSGANTTPAWSWQGRIAFATNRDDPDKGTWEIYSMRPDGSNQVRLTNSPGSEVAPAWSPDGSKIAFQSNCTGNDEIYVMSYDGTSTTKLTDDPSSDVGPAWSPDGSKIAFRSERSGTLQIWVMNADGSNPTMLTDGKPNSAPSYSPDGRTIAFQSQRDGDWEIYVMNADGSNVTRLTDSTGENLRPTFSPDGSKIAFISTRNGSEQLFLINADGSDERAVLPPRVRDSSPSIGSGPDRTGAEHDGRGP